jgi:hypothetical protein
VVRLSRGQFTTFSREEFVQVSREIRWSIGVFIWGMVLETILEANSAYLQKSMPGTWPSDEEVRVIPEVDFDLPPFDTFGKEIDWQAHFQTTAENEVDVADKAETSAG